MIDIKTLFAYIILFGALTVPGYILEKQGKLGESAFPAMTSILTDIAMPFLVLTKLLQTNISDFTVPELIFPLLLALLSYAIIFLLSRIAFRKSVRDQQVVKIFSSVFSNCGFLGIPLAAAMFPDAPKVCALVSIYNVMNTFAVLTLGEYIISGDIKRIKPSGMIFKPVTAAVVLGFAASFFEIGDKLGGAIQYADILASLTTPLSMLVLGAQLARLRFSELFSTASMYVSALLRLFASPLASLALLLAARHIFGIEVSTELACAIMISSAVPTAATASALAAKHGADARLAAILTLGSTILSVVSMPAVSLVYNLFF